MGAELSCDGCHKSIPQGTGPNDTVPVWEDLHSKDMRHLCANCYNPALLLAQCKNPLAYTKRSAWDVLGKEEARALNAARQRPAIDVGTRRPIDRSFWRHCKACGVESATGRRPDDSRCWFCKEPFEKEPAPVAEDAPHGLTYRSLADLEEEEEEEERSPPTRAVNPPVDLYPGATHTRIYTVADLTARIYPVDELAAHIRRYDASPPAGSIPLRRVRLERPNRGRNATAPRVIPNVD